MVIKESEYITLSRNAKQFAVPTNPGLYPANLDVDTIAHKRQIAKHKVKIVEYKTYLGVESYLFRMIVKSVNHKWIAEIESERMGFNHKSPKEQLDHL